MLKEQRIKVGCIGGGQLGRMMALEAPRLNISMCFIDPNGIDSAASLALNHTNESSSSSSSPSSSSSQEQCIIKGKLDDYEKLKELIQQKCDVITFEIEHVGVTALEKLEEEFPSLNIQPSLKIVKIIQDKLLQKQYFQDHDIPVAPFMKISNIDDIKAIKETLGFPVMLKRRKGGYDGKGNAVLEDLEGIDDALAQLGYSVKPYPSELELYAEGWIDFHSELAVMVARSTAGETIAYPATTSVQKDSVCRAVIVPARNISNKQRHDAESIAATAISSLGDGATGVFGVELFVDSKTGAILLNEVAPRPHNSGHYTQDACVCSQFENHLRAVTGMRLGETNLICGAAAMVNILGHESGLEDTLKSVNDSLNVPRTTLHWYGKSHRIGRKMGHVNLTSNSSSEIDEPLSQLLHLQQLSSCSVLRKPSPLVAIIMGSKSDLPTMQAAVDILAQFQIPCEVDIVSAHRTPDKLMSYSKRAANRGIEVIIAGAGGAAHLPGMCAAMTCLPVIGVPIKTSTLNGIDSILSIVQMPKGIPVATVAIGNATNAGLLAVRILSTSRRELREKMEEYQCEMKDKVDMDSEQLLETGSEKFLEKMDNKSTSVNV